MSHLTSSFPISNDDKLGDEKTGVQDLQPTRSIVVGQVEDDRNGEFHRSISPRQIHVSLQYRREAIRESSTHYENRLSLLAPTSEAASLSQLARL